MRQEQQLFSPLHMTDTGTFKTYGHIHWQFWTNTAKRSQYAMESRRIFVLEPESVSQQRVGKRSLWLFYQKDWKGLDYKRVLGEKIPAPKELLNVIENSITRSKVCEAKPDKLKNLASFLLCPTTMRRKKTWSKPQILSRIIPTTTTLNKKVTPLEAVKQIIGDAEDQTHMAELLDKAYCWIYKDSCPLKQCHKRDSTGVSPWLTKIISIQASLKKLNRIF